MVTILSIAGTRPEAIKMAPVLREFARHPQWVRSVFCSAGQHREMLQSVYDVFGMRPDVHLDLMEPDQRLSAFVGRLFSALDGVVCDVKPDWILAQGDTATVFAASMVAFYHRVPFGHVEAGLRTDDRAQPFPEEVHRRVADLAADLLFAPTATAAEALRREGHPAGNIFVTGNTVIDALHEVAARPYDWSAGPLAGIGNSTRRVLVTAHRRESFGPPFRELCRAIRDLACEFDAEGVQFVFPVHLNPNVREPVFDILSGIPNLSLIEPLDYLSFVHLMKGCELILTDSGGIQEEAPGLGIPALVMRQTTERPEGLSDGGVQLVGTDYPSIVSAVRLRLRERRARVAGPVSCPYGDGRAAERIVSIILGRAGVRIAPPAALQTT